MHIKSENFGGYIVKLVRGVPFNISLSLKLYIHQNSLKNIDTHFYKSK